MSADPCFERHTHTGMDMENSTAATEDIQEYPLRAIIEEYGLLLGGTYTFALLLGTILSTNMLWHLRVRQ